MLLNGALYRSTHVKLFFDYRYNESNDSESGKETVLNIDWMKDSKMACNASRKSA